MKKLSEYNALEGLAVLGKLTRAVSPFAKNQAFMQKMRDVFTPKNDDLTLSGAVVFIDFVDLITAEAPDLIIELVAVMSGKDKKAVGKENLLDIAEQAIEMFNDDRLVSFLSKHFSLERSKQPSISTIASGKK